jgi:hypothetical protein
MTSSSFFEVSMRACFFAAACVVSTALAATAAEPLPLVYRDDFEKGMDHWQTRDAPGAESSFAVVEVKGVDGNTTHALRAIGNSKYQPKFRSPPNFALLKDINVGDFEITAKTQNTRPDAGPHRDMCVFWGYQDPTHFYYVHLGAVNTPDTNSCQIFIVNDAARKPITVKQTKGIPWTDDWQNIKVTRNVADGTMEVFYNDMKEPVMTAKDDHFKWGQVGLGTFDDHGNWDDFELHGVEVKPGAAGAGQ